ncbi:MAG: magnesium/cobalt transporter CorA [Gemmataceae bacterium]
MFHKVHEVGAPPGKLSIPEGLPKPRIRAMYFTPAELREEDIGDVDAIQIDTNLDAISWIDVQGFGDPEVVRKIGTRFSLHPLVLEDIVNVPQRPKVESYGDHLQLIVKMVRFDANREIDMEQVSIVLGKHYVLTVQERYDDVLDPVRRRIRGGKGRIRTEGSDYIAYAIFDTIVDEYYPVLERIGDYLSELEELILERPRPQQLRQLAKVKNQLANLRRGIWPQREVANRLARDEEILIDTNVRVFLRDTHDHCVQTSEVIEMYRETVSGLTNIYLSSMSNRTNEVMKVLTIVATIFIPLTFIAGVYGMNFKHMPELEFWWTYPLIWIVMGGIGVAMLWWFHQKGWLGKSKESMKEE